MRRVFSCPDWYLCLPFYAPHEFRVDIQMPVYIEDSIDLFSWQVNTGLDEPLAVEQGRTGVARALLTYRAWLDGRGKNSLTPCRQVERLNTGEIVNLINQHLIMAWPYLQLPGRWATPSSHCLSRRLHLSRRLQTKGYRSVVGALNPDPQSACRRGDCRLTSIPDGRRAAGLSSQARISRYTAAACRSRSNIWYPSG